MALNSRPSKLSRESKLKLAKSRITPVGDSFEHLKMLAYGMNGRGKTRLGASAPKPIIIDCNEKGTLSIRKFDDVEVFKLQTWTDIDLIYWYLKTGNHDRETVVIDTVSSLQMLCMKFVLGDEASRDPTKDPNMAGKREWGKLSELMRTVILNFTSLDDRMHVIFLAQERRGYVDESDDSEAPEIFPSVSPSVRETLTSAVDIIGRHYIREVVRKEKGDNGKLVKKTGVEYRMLIGPHERYMTKDRSESGLPRALRIGSSLDDPPTRDYLTRLIHRITEGATDGDKARR